MFIVVSILLSSSLFADSGEAIAKKLHLKAADKIAKQWEKILNDDAKRKSIGAGNLSASDIEALKKYLKSHSADSDAPLF
jgi:hypothetical protein